jgi:ribonuclease D
MRMETHGDTGTKANRQDRQLIDSAAGVAEICSRITANGRVAVDTEFVWERTYYPNLGIVQLALNEKEAWLLDMPALAGKLDPLGEVLANPQIEKIIHDAKQDLTILRIATGFYPKNIFDTRLAAGFIDQPATLSLLDSGSIFAGLTFDKGETRSNWLKRPLTEKQFQYALDDVLYLPLIRDEIMTRAEKLNHGEWLKEEMRIYDNPALYDDPDTEQVYTKVKGTGRLQRQELAVLLKLAAWREREARSRNRPRRHIISDELLINMAQHQPDDLDQLKDNCQLSPKACQRYGNKLLAVIKSGLQMSPGSYPESLKHARDAKITAQSRKILDLIAETGKNNYIDATMIGTRKEVEKFLLRDNGDANSDSPLMQGWRYELVGEKILSLQETF